MLINKVFVNKPNNVLSWDVFGYYTYLPATFYHNGPDIDNIDWVKKLTEKYDNTATLYQYYKTDKDKWVIKYSMGMALVYLPFFLTGHTIASLTAYPVDGLSLPYQYSLSIGGILIMILGLVIIRKVLLHFTNEIMTALAIFILFFGTNYFITAGMNNLMVHNTLFTFYAIILLFTIKWHKNPSFKNIIGLGIFCGLAILIRPTEIICLLIPFFWNIHNKETFRKKINLLLKYKFQIITFALIIFAIYLPQLFYWKVSTGHFLYYTYNNPGEGLDFFKPHTLQFLFSFRKGWFIYTPMMLFVVYGFYLLYQKKKGVFLPIFLFTVLNIYLLSSWTAWWYANSFGQRSMVQSYALLIIPLCFGIETLIKSHKRIIQVLSVSVLLLLTGLNQFQIWQYNHGILNGSRMTAPYYFKTFGKTKISPETKELLLIERSATAEESFDNIEDYSSTILGIYDFEDTNKYHSKYLDTFSYKGVYAYKLDSTKLFSPGIDIRYYQLTDKDHAWIRTTAFVYPMVDLNQNPASLVCTFVYKGNNYKYRAMDLEKPDYSIKPNQWNKIQFDYLTPEVRRKKDKLKVYFWLRGKEAFYIDDLKIEVFEKKE
jgi:hypothetical protein